MTEVQPPPPLGPLLFAEDVARRFNMTRDRARRWLKWLEEQHGSKVVGRAPAKRGWRRYTTEVALKGIGPHGPAAPNKRAVGESLLEVQDEIRSMQRQLDDMSSRLEAVERRTA